MVHKCYRKMMFPTCVNEYSPRCPKCGKPMDMNDIVGTKAKHPFRFNKHLGETISDRYVCRCFKCGALYELHFLVRSTEYLDGEVEAKERWWLK